MEFEMARSGIQLCYPFEEKRLAKWQPPYIIQPKLDGERCRAIWQGTAYTLLSSEQNLIVSVPHIVQELNDWALMRRMEGLEPILELDGELYYHGWSFEEISSVVGRTKNLHPHYYMLDYHIFDLVTSEPQCQRLEQLREMSKGLLRYADSLKVVQFRLANTLAEIFTIYRNFIDYGYEGIIVREFESLYVRRRSTSIMKFKPKRSDEYEIVELVEAVDKYGKPKAMLGAITCRGDDGTLFRAGAGQLTHDQRRKFWLERDEWPTKTIKVGYQNLTATGGVPRFGIAIELLNKPFKPEKFFNPLLH